MEERRCCRGHPRFRRYPDFTTHTQNKRTTLRNRETESSAANEPTGSQPRDCRASGKAVNGAMLVVLDTNVWISGVLWNGPPHEIISLAERGEFAIASSINIIEELWGVLSRQKFEKHLATAGVDIITIEERVLALAKLYIVRQTVTVITADPPDNAVLACALASNAEMIVSGDDHLLALKQFLDIPILTPRQFLARLTRIENKSLRQM